MERSESFSALTVSRLRIRLHCAGAAVEAAETEDVQVLIQGEDADLSLLQVRLEENRLCITQPLKLALKPLEIKVLLPMTWKGEVDVRSIRGSVSLRGVSGTDLSLHSRTGSVEAENLAAIRMRLSTLLGDVAARELSGEELKLRALAGALEAEGCAFPRISLRALAGEMLLGTAGAFEKVRALLLFGRMRMDAPLHRLDATLTSPFGRLYTNGVSLTDDAPRVRAAGLNPKVYLTNTLSIQAENI